MKNLIEIINTNISDSWGVLWSEMETVRDFLQNFYDANDINNIKILEKDNNITVFAPSIFDWKELIVFGSDKSLDDEAIGNYGEGFKASLLNAMRNFKCSVSMHIGEDLLEFYFEEEKIGKSTKRLIKCKRYKKKHLNGSKLIIKNCTPNLAKEFSFGLNYFYYEENPLFGNVLSSTWENDIYIYESTNKEGYLFYGKLLRAKLDIPIVIVCNRKYKRVDVKIQHDRDRKAFNDEVLNILLKLLFKPLKYNLEDLIKILEPYWRKGNKILSAIASGFDYQNKIEFPDNYYSNDNNFDKNFMSISKVENIKNSFINKGYIGCPGYMAKLGMKSPFSVAIKIENDISLKHTNAYTRKPTNFENKSLQVLFDCIGNFEPFLTDKFNSAKYIIGESEDIIGELKEKKTWNSQKVFLNKSCFLFEFSEALALLLHEWGHIYGYDSSRGFTDALTDFISYTIKSRNIFDEYEKRWSNCQNNIKKERLKVVDNNKEVSTQTILDNLTSKDKIKILKSIPEDELIILLVSDP